MEENNYFHREDKEPLKKKKKSGKSSPRLLFSSLNEELVQNMPGTQTKKDLTVSKTTWKPPLKVNCSFNEHFPAISGDSDGCSVVSSFRSSDLTYFENENNFPSKSNELNLNNFKTFNKCAFADSTDSSKISENHDDQNLDASSYIDYCVEKELPECDKKDLSEQSKIENPKQELKDIKGTDVFSNGLSLNENDDENPYENNEMQGSSKSSENRDFTHSSPRIKLPNKSLFSEMRQKSIEANFELANTSENNIKDIEFKDDELNLCDDNQDTFSKEHSPEINMECNIHTDSINYEEEEKLLIHKSNSKESIEHGNSQNKTSMSEDKKGIDDLPPENLKTQEIEFPPNCHNFGNTDPFQATVSNSQFLRLENEIYASKQELLKNSSELDERKINMIKKNVFAIGNQVEYEKTIQTLRKMINDIEELNTAVVKATMQLRNQHKGSHKQ